MFSKRREWLDVCKMLQTYGGHSKKGWLQIASDLEVTSRFSHGFSELLLALLAGIGLLTLGCSASIWDIYSESGVGSSLYTGRIRLVGI